MNKTYLTFFSATHTSYQVGRAIAEGYSTDGNICELDGTFAPVEPVTLTANDMLIVSVPVYGGHVAPIALKRLNALQGQGTPAAAIVVYGNRNFENAAIELQQFLTERGFQVIAAGAFVGEHSYSTEECPIAPNRPDANDLDDAKNLGKALREKTESAETPLQTDASLLVCPDSGAENLRGFGEFIKAYQAKAQAQAQSHAAPVKLVPQVDESLCTGCGSCASVCPTGAIDADHPETTQADLCIKCCACVKNCPVGARSLATPFAPVLSKFFSKQKANVYVL